MINLAQNQDMSGSRDDRARLAKTRKLGSAPAQSDCQLSHPGTELSPVVQGLFIIIENQNVHDHLLLAFFSACSEADHNHNDLYFKRPSPLNPVFTAEGHPCHGLGAAAKTQDAAEEVRIQNSEARIIKKLLQQLTPGTAAWTFCTGIKKMESCSPPSSDLNFFPQLPIKTYQSAAAKTQDAAADARIQNSETRIIKELHASIDFGKPLLGIFVLMSKTGPHVE